MTGDELREWREGRDLSQRALDIYLREWRRAPVPAYSTRANRISSWETGTHGVPAWVPPALDAWSGDGA